MIAAAIDTGGTFTDGVFFADEKSVAVKVDTTVHDPVECLVDCLRAGAEGLGLELEEFVSEADVIRYATTISTNMLVQQNGDRLGLIVSAGLGDAVKTELAAQDTLLSAVVSPEMIAEVDVQPALDEDALVAAVRQLLQQGARALVIAFDQAWLNPTAERAARSAIRGSYPRHYLGAVPVILSSDIAVRGPVSAAWNAAVLNAYVHRKMAAYLYRADESLRNLGSKRPLLIVQSHGGVSRVAKTLAVNTCGSGPAAGVTAGSRLSDARDLGRLVLLDIGGTSADIAITEAGGALPDALPSIEGTVISVPMIQVESFGGGGGSIVHVAGGETAVGPQSAGASPGPACYGLGGRRPTITDAHVVVGHIDPESFLGGRRRLDKERALRAISEVASELGDVTPEDAAIGACDVLDEMIAARIAELAASEGVALESLSLLAFGGGGALHAANVARHLGIRQVVVPRLAATLCAWGASTMDVRHVYDRRFSPGDTFVDDMRASSLRDMGDEGVASSDVSIELQFCPADGDSFMTIEDAVAIDQPGTLRLVASSPTASPTDLIVEAPRHDAVPAGHRPVTWLRGEEPRSTPIFRAEDLGPGASYTGEAIIEHELTTVLVPPRASFEVGGDKSLILTIQ